VRPHLPEEEIHAWLDRQLSRAQSREIAEHLMGCLICRALEAEVRQLRDRSNELLAIAAPRRINGIPAAARESVGPSRAQLRRGSMVAAAAIALGLGSWAFTRDEPVSGGPRITTALVAPAIFARIGEFASNNGDSSAAPANAAQQRTLALAARATLSPRVIPARVVHSPVANRKLQMVDPILGVGPGGSGWETTSLSKAREASPGGIAHLDGVTVNAVRLQQSELGGRPTAMVRHVLQDGKAVWVIEGTVQELEPITRVLEASGLTLSSPRRARPDYLGSDEEPIRTTRMVAVAGFLPIDSLESIASSRLRLD
jgi:hypothetical protein